MLMPNMRMAPRSQCLKISSRYLTISRDRMILGYPGISHDSVRMRSCSLLSAALRGRSGGRSGGDGVGDGLLARGSLCGRKCRELFVDGRRAERLHELGHADVPRAVYAIRVRLGAPPPAVHGVLERARARVRQGGNERSGPGSWNLLEGLLLASTSTTRSFSP